MFDALALEVKEVTNLDLQSLGDDEISEAVVELARLRSALEAGEARLTKAWDDRRGWAADGAKAGSAWLARRTREAFGTGEEGTASAPSQPSPSTAEVRAWARANGLVVPDRGRLRPDIHRAWEEGHQT